MTYQLIVQILSYVKCNYIWSVDFCFSAFVRNNFHQIWFVYVELHYLQLFIIIAYHVNAHIMLLQYVICNYTWHMGSQNYELSSLKVEVLRVPIILPITENNLTTNYHFKGEDFLT